MESFATRVEQVFHPLQPRSIWYPHLVQYLTSQFIARCLGSKLCKLKWGLIELINVVAAWNVVQLPERIMFVCFGPKCEMAGC